MQQQECTHQYRNMMQNQKHQQVRHYNKSARDLPSLKTGYAVYIQLVPNVRRWIPATIVEILSARSCKVRTIKGGIYVRKQENLLESDTQTQNRGLRLYQRDREQSEGTTHTGRPKRTTRRPTKTHRVNKLYTDKIHTEEIHITCKRLYF